MTRGSVWGCEAEDSWLRVPAELVDALLAEHAARCAGGAWSRPMAALYLRRCQDKALLSARFAFPSLRQLAAMWGWTVGTVRGLLQRESDWGDPHKAGAWLSHPRSDGHELLIVVEAVEALADVFNTATTQLLHKPGTGAAQHQHNRDRRTPEVSRGAAQSQHSDDTVAAQAQHSDDNTGAVHRSPPPITNNRKNSHQPPAEREAFVPDPVLVEAVVALLLDMGPLSAEADARMQARLQGRDKWTGEQMRKDLAKLRRLAAGTRSWQVSSAGVLALPLWLARRSWTLEPAEPGDRDIAAEQRALVERLEAEAADRARQDELQREQARAADPCDPDPVEAEELRPDVLAFAEALSDDWTAAPPAEETALRSGFAPALIRLQKARGTALPLVEVKRGVMLALGRVDSRRLAAGGV